jgi:hypothetical protein
MWSGNSTTRTLTGLGFTNSVGLAWVKSRSNAVNHVLQDAVRGFTTGKKLGSNITDAEGAAGNLDDSYGYISSTSATGFTIDKSGTGQDWVQMNASGYTYAGWCWDAGSSTVTNTQGSISSQVRANASAGFSIVTWTGDGVGGRTVGHGLGVAPAFVVIKQRIAGPGTDLYNWNSYHSALGATKFIALNTTGATITAPLFNDTAPTSTVFSLGSSTSNYQNVNNASGVTYVAYAWAPLVGYSSFGSYTGNGSADGPFVYTGFRPRWILLKNASDGYDGGGSIVNSHSWVIYDSARGTYNAAGQILAPNKSFAEENNLTDIDILSNGFKLRTNRSAMNPGSTQTMVYAAFAESPFGLNNRAR